MTSSVALLAKFDRLRVADLHGYRSVALGKFLSATCLAATVAPRNRVTAAATRPGRQRDAHRNASLENGYDATHCIAVPKFRARFLGTALPFFVSGMSVIVAASSPGRSLASLPPPTYPATRLKPTLARPFWASQSQSQHQTLPKASSAGASGFLKAPSREGVSK